jgi:hypothetical protein
MRGLFPSAKHSEMPFALRHLRVDFRGAARARNYGARHATGRIINFPDDDCELTSGLLRKAQAAMQDGKLRVLVGMSVNRDGRPSTTRFKSGRTPLTLWNMWGRSIEFTMFFDRVTFLECGGFDEEFGVGSTYGADEGPELLIRMLRQLDYGAVVYDASLRFYHPDKIEGYPQAALTRSFSYARGTGALWAKWPLLPVHVYGANLLARTLVASLLFRGAKREYYLHRLAGLREGFRDFRSRKSTPYDAA